MIISIIMTTETIITMIKRGRRMMQIMMMIKTLRIFSLIKAKDLVTTLCAECGR